MTRLNDGDPHPRRIVVVINPYARFARDDVEAELLRQAPPGTEIVVRGTDLSQPVSRLIGDVLPGATVVVAVGGDGTVSYVANALAGYDIPLAIIPGGSTNMVAKVNRVPSGLRGAASLIFSRHSIERIDVGRCGEKSLVHIGGSGLDAQIFARSLPDLKRKIGWLAYVPPALPSVRSPSSDYLITVDGRTIAVRSKLVLVANSASLVSARFTLFPGVSRQDGLFDVFVFTADSGRAITRSLADILTPGRSQGPYIVHLKGRDISIGAEPAMPFELDGDIAGMTPFRVIVEPAALSMICAAKP
ncbi:diacylglycerol kinase family lipid kinase [soil metagenome]